nr:O-antigen ligase family protein [Rhizobium metallidurans]
MFGCFLWLLAASALLVESDTYRYASGILAIIALVYYVKEPSRPRTNWLGWLCMGWAAYVLARFAYIYITTENHDLGASDWLFAFPLFFPILGIAFALYENQMEKIIAAFFVVALIMLAVTVSRTIGTITTGVAVSPLIMNNQIHGAVACGLIFVTTTFWLLHYVTTPNADPRFARLAQVIAPIILVLCLIAIYGAKSKGVWLAMTFTLPVIAVLGMHYIRIRARSGLMIACAAILLVGGIYAVRQNLDQTAGPTVRATASMIGGIWGSSNRADAITQAIQSGETPTAMDERLQLWSNGWELFSSAPVFGWGNQWLERWQQTRYATVAYTLLHNGYLEILVRFGLFGAFVMALILASFVVSVVKAYRRGLIPRAAMHTYLVCIFFFALTLLSNSNNRLAIGESLALVTSAFACWCNLRLRSTAREASPWPAAA